MPWDPPVDQEPDHAGHRQRHARRPDDVRRSALHYRSALHHERDRPPRRDDIDWLKRGVDDKRELLAEHKLVAPDRFELSIS